MPFLKEPEPSRGVALEVLPSIRRIVARNPGVMTYHGTNTYLIEQAGSLTVVDPGPDDAKHVRDILNAAGAVPVQRIIVTHAHHDHFGATEALKAATGAAVYGFVNSSKKEFHPDVALAAGDAAGGLIGVYTPGHASDHLCFEYHCENVGTILFSGDHVMSWSSSIVSPPDGNMEHYYQSLNLLLRRDDVLYLPGHGPTLPEPRILVAELLSYRQRREARIIEALEGQSWNVAALANKLYAKTDQWLKNAAQRNVLAHLLKLQAEGVVTELPAVPWQAQKALTDAISNAVEREGGGGQATLERDAVRRFAFHPKPAA